jgi:hypothetical protein
MIADKAIAAKYHASAGRSILTIIRTAKPDDELRRRFAGFYRYSKLHAGAPINPLALCRERSGDSGMAGECLRCRAAQGEPCPEKQATQPRRRTIA